jgi:hypothetical protein
LARVAVVLSPVGDHRADVCDEQRASVTSSSRDGATVSDEEIRELERRARDGDARSTLMLRRRRGAMDQDFEGIALDAPRAPTRFGAYTVTLVTVEPGLFAACVEHVRHRFDDVLTNQEAVRAALDAGVRWVVVDVTESLLDVDMTEVLTTLVPLRQILFRRGGDVLVVTREEQRGAAESLGLASIFPPYDHRIAALRAILTDDVEARGPLPDQAVRFFGPGLGGSDIRPGSWSTSNRAEVTCRSTSRARSIEGR